VVRFRKVGKVLLNLAGGDLLTSLLSAMDDHNGPSVTLKKDGQVKGWPPLAR